MPNLITEKEALEYEIAGVTFLQSFLYLWLSKHFVKKCKRKYIRYLGYMEYKRVSEEKRQQDIARTKENFAKMANAGINSIGNIFNKKP